MENDEDQKNLGADINPDTGDFRVGESHPAPKLKSEIVDYEAYQILPDRLIPLKLAVMQMLAHVASIQLPNVDTSININSLVTEEESKVSDRADIVRAYTAAKIELMHLPQSMQMSDQAFERYRSSTGQIECVVYQFEQYSEARQASEDNGVGSYFQETPSEDSYYIIAYKSFVPVGSSLFCIAEMNPKAAYVGVQHGEPSIPGVGLKMLETMIQECRRMGLESLTLSTTKQPRGLGNIGFKFVTEPTDEEGIYYRIDL